MTVDELVTMVNIALGTGEISSCPVADHRDDGSVTIDEIVAAVANALNGLSRLKTVTRDCAIARNRVGARADHEQEAPDAIRGADTGP